MQLSQMQLSPSSPKHQPSRHSMMDSSQPVYLLQLRNLPGTTAALCSHKPRQDASPFGDLGSLCQHSSSPLLIKSYKSCSFVLGNGLAFFSTTAAPLSPKFRKVADQHKDGNVISQFCHFVMPGQTFAQQQQQKRPDAGYDFISRKRMLIICKDII